MNTNVYVAGLPQDVNEETLQQIFEGYGLITSLKACKGKGPTTPGFGFVRFQTEQEAQDAIAATNGLDFGGQTLTVRLANNEPGAAGAYPAYAPAAVGKGFGKSGPPPSTLAQRNIYVAGLPQFTSDMALINMFKGFGNVLSVKVGADQKADRKYGFVNFEHPEEAAYAIESMNGKPVQGVALQVRYANADKNQGMGPSYDAFNYTPPVKEYTPQAAGSANPPPSANLYVKGLPAGLTELEVQTLFSGYGEVCSCKVLDQGTQGCTVAMVRMVNMEDATWVVENVNGNIPDGFQNPVQIRYADPPKGSVAAAPVPMPQAWTSKAPVTGPVKQVPQSQRSSPYGASAPQTVQPVVLTSAATPELMQAVSETVSEVKGFQPLAKNEEDPSNLYVKGLPVNADELYIYYVFAPFGAIQSVRVMRDDTGACSGTALVKFGLPEDAELAMSTLTGNPLPDHVVLDVSVKTVKGWK